MYGLLSVCVCVCLSVCLCTEHTHTHTEYTPFSDLHLLISRLSSGKHTHTHTHKREMLKDASSNLTTASCVCKFVAKRARERKHGIYWRIVVAVPMINSSMHKARCTLSCDGLYRPSVVSCWAIVGILVFIICKIRRQSFSHQINI